MAKVYSWYLDKIDGVNKYSYIVNPDTLNEPYVGDELNDSSVMKVSKWAQECTDTQYKNNFAAMVAMVNSDGRFNVEFENVEAYLNVPSACDNLRGPAGRGISELIPSGETNNGTIYVLKYDDGTFDTFVVRNGKDGLPGKDGTPGAKGDDGITTRNVIVFKSGKDGEPAKPNGGSWNHITGEITYPIGWGPSDDVVPPVYQSTRTFASDDRLTDAEWSYPIKLSGDDGKPGTDGLNIEFIYQRFESSKVDAPDTNGLPSPNENGFVPNNWTHSPEGVNEDYHVEFVSTRTRENNVWGSWSPATIWSQYGVNGQDGDGIQYIYLLSKDGIKPKNPTPSNYDTNSDYQDKDYEWIPPVGSYVNIKSETVTWSDDTKWTDNPCGVTVSAQYEWVSQRKFKKSSKDSDNPTWQIFSEPTLWAKYGEQGEMGYSVRTLYALTTSTDEEPDVNNLDFNNPGSEWGTGFPKDYIKDENVVWGISATIKGNGFLNPETGWEGPFLVTGVKGDSAIPMDYNIISFCYAPKNNPPMAPETGVSADGTLTSPDGYTWEDWPDTSNGRVDGAKDESGIVMRWYQCTATVDGQTKVVLRWGTVVPNGAIDGEMGPYTEFRFAVTPDGNKPNLVSIVDGEPVRNPITMMNGVQIGWWTTDENLPEVTGDSAMWQIWAKVDSTTDKIIMQDGIAWSGPKRVSGEKGIEGKRGPAGQRGITGLPGSSLIPIYCLGTSDIYFGSDNELKNLTGKDYGKFKEEMTTWYVTPPNANVIEVTNEEDFNDVINITKNAGRVVRKKYTNGTDEYYLINSDKTATLIDETNIERDEENKINFYIWCTQGSSVSAYNNNEEPVEVGVKWGATPFMLGGTNGLRGLPGTRGQVVYPMGVYNPNEVYITTEETAPYVYDAGDGCFYVLNVTDNPWVGILPEDYKTIKTEDGYYKYMYNGEWIETDQNGQTPSQNFANNETPVWVRFESFEAIYTSIGIIENGMIGSAVYNNEFMFSQQGIDKNGNPTNYANVNKPPVNSGFLSAYQYDESGKTVNGGKLHWKYRNTDNYLKDNEVNPYETNNGSYIHEFMPNVCINFKTGQMWASCGKNHFDYDGSGYLAGNNISWNSTGRTIFGNINDVDANGIVIDNGTLTIGPLRNYATKKEVEDIQSEYELLQKNLKDLEEVVSNQGDNKAETWYQSTDPSTQSGWVPSEHVGDLWFDTDEETMYTYIMYTENGTTKYKWVSSAIPQTLLDDVDGKSSIYVSIPLNGYDANDIWILEKDYTSKMGKYATEGAIFVAEEDGASATTSTFAYNNWKEASKYLTEQRVEELTDSFDEELGKFREEFEKDINDIRGQVDQKAQTWYQATDPSMQSDWVNSEHVGDLWFDTDTNVTYRYDGTRWNMQDVPSYIFDRFDGKSAIFISKPTSDLDGDGYLYKKNDLWLLDKDYKTESGKQGAVEGSIWVATQSQTTASTFTWSHWDKKGTELDNWIENEFSDIIEGITEQPDGVVNTHYGDSDPSNGWQNDNSAVTSTYADNHLGDLWFNTTKGVSYVYSDTTANTASYLIASPSGYYWVEADVPQSVYDYADGKMQMFTEQPKVPYNKGDLWLKGFNSNNSAGTNVDIYTAIIDRAVGDSVLNGKDWIETDWIKASDYTNDDKANQAIGRLEGILDDGYVSPNEITSLSSELQIITNEYQQIIIQCKTFGFNNSGHTYNSEYKNYTITYDTYKGILEYYTNKDNAISDENSKYYQCIPINNQSRPLSYGQYYYKNRQIIQNALVSEVEHNMQGKLDAWGSDGYLSPVEQKALRDRWGNETEVKNNIIGLTTKYGLTSSTNCQAFTLLGVAIKSVIDYYAPTAETAEQIITEGEYTGCIKIEYTESGLTIGSARKYYGNIAAYYELKDKVLSEINEAMAASAVSSANTVTDTYRNEMAMKLGYRSYDDMVSKTESGNTIIKGAHINTQLIETEAIITEVLSAIDITAENIEQKDKKWGLMKDGSAYFASTGGYDNAKIKINESGDTYIGGFTILDNGSLNASSDKNICLIGKNGVFIRRLGYTELLNDIENEILIGDYANTGNNTSIALKVKSIGDAIYCSDGMYSGLRPRIRSNGTDSTITATTEDHTIITYKNFGEGETRTIHIPKNPPIGQEYVILCPHRHSASNDDKKSKLTISIIGGGTFYCINNGNQISNSITWKESTVECKLWWDGVYWFYSYNSWQA